MVDPVVFTLKIVFALTMIFCVTVGMLHLEQRMLGGAETTMLAACVSQSCD